MILSDYEHLKSEWRNILEIYREHRPEVSIDKPSSHLPTFDSWNQMIEIGENKHSHKIV